MGELRLSELRLSEVDSTPSGYGSNKNHSTLDLNYAAGMTRVERAIWSILVSLLRSSNENPKCIIHAVSAAVKEIDDLYPPPPKGCMEENEIRYLWDCLIKIVQRVPYDHPNQEVFVLFLKRLRGKERRPAPLPPLRHLSFEERRREMRRSSYSFNARVPSFLPLPLKFTARLIITSLDQTSKLDLARPP
jgi:hypothetical protein